MIKEKQLLKKEKSLGDTAVDGLLAGTLAGITSALYLLVVGLATSQAPAEVLGRFDPRLDGNALIGGLMHLAVAAIYGLLFGVLYRPLSRRWPAAQKRTWLLGVIWGLILMLLAETAFLSGFDSLLTEISTIHFGVFHVVYGLTLGLALVRIGGES